MKPTMPRNSIPSLLLILLLLACFGLSPVARADSPSNTRLGVHALQGNTTGELNTGIGFQALQQTSAGNSNTAVGGFALASNTTASNNTAIGEGALSAHTTGSFNTAVGGSALGFFHTTGSSNTALGYRALSNLKGTGNIALGDNAGSELRMGDRNVDIGNKGDFSESRTIRIGDFNQTRTFIAGISGAVVSGAAVFVNAGGQLGVAASSARFKDEIKPMDTASEAILSLKPVSFRYKKEVDPDGTPQFGLVAEEVEKVNPDLVVRDADGKAYTVRYDAVNAMLLNEFIKEHRTVQELKKEIAALTARVQKVSAQMEMSRPAPRIVDNHQ